MKTKALLLVWLLSITLGLAIAQTGSSPSSLASLHAPDIAKFVKAVQPDGKRILAGRFGSVLGVPRNFLARLNVDGTVDMDFDLHIQAVPPPVEDQGISSVVVQPDGKILVAGVIYKFMPKGTTAVQKTDEAILRLNSDGSLDPTFSAPIPNLYVSKLALQQDGKVLVGGNFNELTPKGSKQPVPRGGIARLNTDGSLDLAFNPMADRSVLKIEVRPDGKLDVSGRFTALRPNNTGPSIPRAGQATLNPDGTVAER